MDMREKLVKLRHNEVHSLTYRFHLMLSLEFRLQFPDESHRTAAPGRCLEGRQTESFFKTYCRKILEREIWE